MADFPELQNLTETPIDVIANVSRVVTRVVDRVTGDRNEVPLMVASATVEALKRFGIESRIMYGQVAWIEVLEDHSVVWAGCWGEYFHFWVATQFGEVVDLNVSVAFRKRSHSMPDLRPMLSAPMLWSREVPAFYRYKPEGIAELELTSADDQRRYDLVLQEIREKCGPLHIRGQKPEFVNEPILCPGRRLLDDTHQSFKRFERAIGVHGIPESPISI